MICYMFLFLCSDGTMTLFRLHDGGLLGEYYTAVQAGQTVAAAAFSYDDKELCAVAYAQCCIVVTSPWGQRACSVKACHVCPEVHGLVSAQSAAAAVVFGPDNSVLYSSPLLQHELIEFDDENGKILRTFSLQCQPKAMHASSCGTLLAYADANGSVGLLKCQEGTIKLLQGMTCSVASWTSLICTSRRTAHMPGRSKHY